MKYYVVDAFTDQHFCGNPAGVCLMNDWPEDSLMQNIAFENNLAETAFVVERDGYYDLRWFTPRVEMDLCGHATLGSAFVLMNQVNPDMNAVEFHTRSGPLYVKKDKGILVMDFPSRKPVPCEKPAYLEKALGVKISETHLSRDLLALVEDESVVRNLQPDFSTLREMGDAFAIMVTARGKDCDFVSRFFAPGVGVDEDPVTGSSHATLIPFWSERLNKTELLARQLSPRGGTLYCRDCGSRVEIGGKAVLYFTGEIQI
jgi:PhzF family phenazine biosynthesis protein